jgi:Cd2+/Zn2+-exporting ATPase
MPPTKEKQTNFILTPWGELLSAGIAGVLLVVGFVLSHTGEPGSSMLIASSVCAYVALAIGLFHGGRAALEALRGGVFDIDVLMFVGAVLAAFIGAASEGALLLFLFVLSGALEELALQRTTRAVEALHKLMPTSALRLRSGAAADDADAWEKVEPEALVPGDRVRILPGEIVPVDSSVVAGESSINQANLTGESMPRDVKAGAELFAGTINVGNPIEATVLRPATQSSLQKILNLVTTAQQQREPIQQTIDRLSQPYAISVFAGAIVAFLVFWLPVGRSASDAAYIAITLLIVASPCALIIATPTATLAAISRAARGGVLFKGGSAIARLARLSSVAFDKTGTLTVGKPRVLRVLPVGWSNRDRLLAVASGLEQQSTHPIAEAIVACAKEPGVSPAPCEDVQNVVGRGVSAMFDGKPARLGSLKHTLELIPVCLQARVRQTLDAVQSLGHIGVVCAYDEQAAVFILADSTRPGAECLVRRLHEQGVRPVVMLTGDNRATAERVAASLGLDEIHAELLPGDKVDHVQRLKSAGEHGAGGSSRGKKRFTGVIGDGVNDAPALAAADVSIAIGSIGSDAALESADIVLLSDDLSTVPWALHLARRARRTITINLVFALGAMALMAVTVVIASAMQIKIPLWMGVVGHEGGTLLVVAHSLLLLAFPGIPVCICQDHAHHAGGELFQATLDNNPLLAEPAGLRAGA